MSWARSADRSGVYGIRCLANGRSHIGSSTNVDARLKWHRGFLTSGIHRSASLQADWRRYGPAAFAFEVMELAPAEDLLRLEQEYLDRVRPFKARLYNECLIAVRPPMRSEDTKTDNHNLAAKLSLRRYFLDQYHPGEYFSVFDCCQGSGTIWKAWPRNTPSLTGEST